MNTFLYFLMILISVMWWLPLSLQIRHVTLHLSFWLLSLYPTASLPWSPVVPAHHFMPDQSDLCWESTDYSPLGWLSSWSVQLWQGNVWFVWHKSCPCHSGRTMGGTDPLEGRVVKEPNNQHF